MGTRKDSTDTQTVVSKKPSNCSVCRKPISISCDWKQGRCPNLPSLAEQIINDRHKSRFYNLFTFFKNKLK
jgi:hypothetical protein